MYMYCICSNRSQLRIDAGLVWKAGVNQALKSINARSRINARCQLWAWQFNVYLTIRRGVASCTRSRSKCSRIVAISYLLFQRF